ncbi:MAG: AAA family ATPase [Gemmatimonadetes bacterium]|nr:AAA family ATPase [Gemmatimonadota bacterium]
MKFEQDPRFTFETFVVGPGNRMAAAAARHVAESPGTSYNPLWVYGAAGTGKSHLLRAVAALASAVRPELRVVLETAEGFASRLSTAIAAGGLDAFRDELLEAGLLVIDDAEALAGKARTQEELVSLWDDFLRHNVQLIFAATLSPAELGETDEALRGRLGDGMVVDIAPPGPETRREIVRRHAAGQGVELESGVDDVLANLTVAGAHELHATVDRIAAVQAERGAPVSAAEVPAIVDGGAAPNDEFSAFLSDIAFTVGQLVEEAPWRKRLAEAILRWEGEGVRTRRLESALDADAAPDVDAVLEGFAADVAKLRALRDQLVALDEKAATSPVLADPDRVGEAEAMLLSARAAAERRRAQEPAAPPVDRWYFTNAEKVAWGWIALDDRLIEELA